MSQPYSTPTNVLNQVLTQLLTQAAWDLSADVILRIQEGDSEIDSRLGALGYVIPFTSNPPMLLQLSVMYARYAIFRDLYAGGSPSAGTNATQEFKDAFEEKFQKLEDGWASLVDASGNVITSQKFGVKVAQNTAPVDDAPGILISTYMSDTDTNDGLSPSEGGVDEDSNNTNNERN